jgi:TonB-linked SusC/RagA family outer membrane protein
LDYTYKDKYFINATIRRDGSSALGSNNRFDVFPSFGAGWIISEENFLVDNSFINLVKLRAGWGAVGNQNSLGNFSYFSNFSQDPNFTSTGYDITASNSGNPANGIALLSRGNPNLKWESSQTLNIGMDFSLFDYKFSGSVEWYDRRTKDLLLQPPAPLTAGIASPSFVNLGEIQNKGIDLSLSYNGKVGALDVGVSGIVSAYKNSVLDLDGNPESFFQGPGGNPNVIAARTAVGNEIGAFYGLIVDGVIQEGDKAGNFNFRDLDNNGIINFRDQDFIGSPHPDFTYSLNLTANYRNFDFTAFIRGSQGNDIWAYSKLFTDFQFRSGVNRSTRVLDAWRPDNPSNSLAEFNLNTSNSNLRASSYYVEDGSYVRLQTIQFGYTFPKIGLGIEKLRIYLQGQNLFTITNYSGIDPEIGENGGLELGVDRGGTYTVPRSFLLGIQVSL